MLQFLSMLLFQAFYQDRITDMGYTVQAGVSNLNSADRFHDGFSPSPGVSLSVLL